MVDSRRLRLLGVAAASHLGLEFGLGFEPILFVVAVLAALLQPFLVGPRGNFVERDAVLHHRWLRHGPGRLHGFARLRGRGGSRRASGHVVPP